MEGLVADLANPKSASKALSTLHARAVAGGDISLYFESVVKTTISTSTTSNPGPNESALRAQGYNVLAAGVLHGPPSTNINPSTSLLFTAVVAPRVCSDLSTPATPSTLYIAALSMAVLLPPTAALVSALTGALHVHVADKPLAAVLYTVQAMGSLLSSHPTAATAQSLCTALANAALLADNDHVVSAAWTALRPVFMDADSTLAILDPVAPQRPTSEPILSALLSAKWASLSPVSALSVSATGLLDLDTAVSSLIDGLADEEGARGVDSLMLNPSFPLGVGGQSALPPSSSSPKQPMGPGSPNLPPPTSGTPSAPPSVPKSPSSASSPKTPKPRSRSNSLGPTGSGSSAGAGSSSGGGASGGSLTAILTPSNTNKPLHHANLAHLRASAPTWFRAALTRAAALPPALATPSILPITSLALYFAHHPSVWTSSWTSVSLPAPTLTKPPVVSTPGRRPPLPDTFRKGSVDSSASGISASAGANNYVAASTPLGSDVEEWIYVLVTDHLMPLLHSTVHLPLLAEAASAILRLCRVPKADQLPLRHGWALSVARAFLKVIDGSPPPSPAAPALVLSVAAALRFIPPGRRFPVVSRLTEATLALPSPSARLGSLVTVARQVLALTVDAKTAAATLGRRTLPPPSALARLLDEHAGSSALPELHSVLLIVLTSWLCPSTRTTGPLLAGKNNTAGAESQVGVSPLRPSRTTGAVPSTASTLLNQPLAVCEDPVRDRASVPAWIQTALDVLDASSDSVLPSSASDESPAHVLASESFFRLLSWVLAAAPRLASVPSGSGEAGEQLNSRLQALLGDLWELLDRLPPHLATRALYLLSTHGTLESESRCMAMLDALVLRLTGIAARCRAMPSIIAASQAGSLKASYLSSARAHAPPLSETLLLLSCVTTLAARGSPALKEQCVKAVNGYMASASGPTGRGTLHYEAGRAAVRLLSTLSSRAVVDAQALLTPPPDIPPWSSESDKPSAGNSGPFYHHIRRAAMAAARPNGLPSTDRPLRGVPAALATHVPYSAGLSLLGAGTKGGDADSKGRTPVQWLSGSSDPVSVAGYHSLHPDTSGATWVVTLVNRTPVALEGAVLTVAAAGALTPAAAAPVVQTRLPTLAPDASTVWSTPFLLTALSANHIHASVAIALPDRMVADDDGEGEGDQENTGAPQGGSSGGPSSGKLVPIEVTCSPYVMSLNDLLAPSPMTSGDWQRLWSEASGEHSCYALTLRGALTTASDLISATAASPLYLVSEREWSQGRSVQACWATESWFGDVLMLSMTAGKRPNRSGGFAMQSLAAPPESWVMHLKMRCSSHLTATAVKEAASSWYPELFLGQVRVVDRLDPDVAGVFHATSTGPQAGAPNAPPNMATQETQEAILDRWHALKAVREPLSSPLP